MRRALWLALLALSIPMTGCLGSVSPAEIPQDRLDQENWEKTKDDRRSVAFGLAELATKEHEPSASGASNLVGVVVATLNDVPFLDERERLIPIAIEQVEKDKGVTFEEAGTRSLDLVNLGTTVEATEYNVRQGAAEAKAVLFTPSCSDFVVVVAYGPIDTGGDDDGGPLGGVTGGSSSSSITHDYGKARKVARGVTC